MDEFYDFIKSDDMNLMKNKHSDFDKFFSMDELQIIFEGIEKTDFTSCGETRWRDLEMIIDNIIERKKKYKECKIKKLVLASSHERWPPINNYVYHYDVNYSFANYDEE
jgi:hypothetical protein